MYILLSEIEPINNSVPLSFEDIDSSYGYVLYRTILPKKKNVSSNYTLKLIKLHDRASILVDKVSFYLVSKWCVCV